MMDNWNISSKELEYTEDNANAKPRRLKLKRKKAMNIHTLEEKQ